MQLPNSLKEEFIKNLLLEDLSFLEEVLALAKTYPEIKKITEKHKLEQLIELIQNHSAEEDDLWDAHSKIGKFSLEFLKELLPQ